MIILHFQKTCAYFKKWKTDFRFHLRRFVNTSDTGACTSWAHVIRIAASSGDILWCSFRCFTTDQIFKIMWTEDMIDHHSYTHSLSYCEIKAWKKFRPGDDLNPWRLRYRCRAPPNELSSHLGAGQVVSCNVPVEVEECKWIYEKSPSWTAEKDMKTSLIIAVIHTT